MLMDFKVFIKRQLKRIPLVASVAANMHKIHIVDDRIQIFDAKLRQINDALRQNRDATNDVKTLQDELHNVLANFEKSIPVVLRSCARQTRHPEATAQPTLPQDALAAVFRRIEYTRCEALLAVGGVDLLQRSFLSHTPRIVNQQKFAEYSAEGCIKVNICCDHDARESYLNVASWPMESIDIVAEASNLPFTSNQVDEIWIAHIDERFPYTTQRELFIPYWLGLLKPDGILRCSAAEATPLLPVLKALGIAAIDVAEIGCATSERVRYEIAARRN